MTRVGFCNHPPPPPPPHLPLGEWEVDLLCWGVSVTRSILNDSIGNKCTFVVPDGQRRLLPDMHQAHLREQRLAALPEQRLGPRAGGRRTVKGAQWRICTARGKQENWVHILPLHTWYLVFPTHILYWGPMGQGGASRQPQGIWLLKKIFSTHSSPPLHVLAPFGILPRIVFLVQVQFHSLNDTMCELLYGNNSNKANTITILILMITTLLWDPSCVSAKMERNWKH